MIKEINGQLVKKLIDGGKNLTLIDARDKNEYEKGHLPKSISLLNSEVEKRKEEILKFDRPIIVYSKDGNCPASGLVAKKIFKIGINEVYNYNQSYADWVKRGYKVTKSK